MLFALLLIGPVVLLFTLVVVLVVAATLVALTGAILATPYLLVRYVRAHRPGHTSNSAPATPFVPVQSPRVAA